MMDYLQNLDAAVFHFVNSSLQNPVLDILMPFITNLNKHTTVLVIVSIILILLFVKGGSKGKYAVIVLALGILFSDQLNSSVAKFILARPRPCHVLPHVHLLVGCGSGYSFPSSHAVNNFCGAVILSFFFPQAAVWLYTFAGVVSFSRVYVGVHYPADVLGGAVIGICCGLVMIALFLLVEHLALGIIRRVRKPGIEKGT
jgi:undecaprenyl-diphosphatase